MEKNAHKKRYDVVDVSVFLKCNQRDSLILSSSNSHEPSTHQLHKQHALTGTHLTSSIMHSIAGKEDMALYTESYVLLQALWKPINWDTIWTQSHSMRRTTALSAQLRFMCGIV